ncbi:uncharacterized protein zgc:92242 [Cheilinus undulatus]|uniref:uncharacterized protein zgc:92242 n=1 Tax=Cheilinus undulatus TaxID=241271 RepID=UPI001BD6D09C|nr:uncharacterized protein zgc:92242 [Cheilinus undulatus]
MLAKILEDMWVEPKVLEALSDEQKRILFLKMREEQVRRWREREEREEKGGRDNNTGPKKAYKKHVSWLLGRDGDVSVSVIGEVDEFRSSKLLQSLMNNSVCSEDMNGIQTVDMRPGSEAQLGSKEDVQLALPEDDSASLNSLSSEEDNDSCSTYGDLKDQENSGSESEIPCCEGKKTVYGGRVARLRKAFTDEPSIPAQPVHLQKRNMPFLY